MLACIDKFVMQILIRTRAIVSQFENCLETLNGTSTVVSLPLLGNLMGIAGVNTGFRNKFTQRQLIDIASSFLIQSVTKLGEKAESVYSKNTHSPNNDAMSKILFFGGVRIGISIAGHKWVGR